MREYVTKDLVVRWYPELCSRVGKCYGILPEVFRPEKRPWIDLTQAPPEKIVETIKKCPSGALEYVIPPGSRLQPEIATEKNRTDRVRIRVVNNGPFLVEGPITLTDGKGNLIKEMDKAVLCRCGKTKNPPFCDGEHVR